MLKCIKCQILFKPARTNNKSPQKFCSRQCSVDYRTQIKTVNKCLHCQKDTLNPKFCNNSCAALHTNPGRIHTPETKNKIRNKLTKPKRITLKNTANPNLLTFEICGEYTRIYLCRCKHTNIQWYSPNIRSIHPSCINNYQTYSYLCKFNFGISSYPGWFTNASSLISEHGWYSTPGSRKGKKNLNGISRDHMISISFGFKNNIDPSIIAHPANCKLMNHSENSSKKTDCSLTFEELLKRIVDFNEMYTASTFGIEPNP